MDKLTMAHEYAIEMAKQGIPLKSCKELGWKYADAMQAEADKRKEKGFPEAIKFPELVAHGFNEWQPDWSQAPEWAKYWIKTSGGSFAWLDRKPDISKINPHWNVECFKKSFAPSFNYQGDWQDSLRKRPEGK